MFETLRKSYTRLFIALALLSSAQLRPAAGDLDTSFGTGGIVDTPVETVSGANDVGIQANGNIVAGGFSTVTPITTQFTLARYLTNGSLDGTFGTGGIVTTSISATSMINAIGIQDDQEIVAGGYSGINTTITVFTLARYNTDGSLDTTGFNAGGGQPGVVTTTIGATSVINDVDFQSTGKIIAVGSSILSIPGATRITVARYNTDGTLDTSFNAAGTGSGQPGVAILSVSAADVANNVAIQPDDKIVIAGSTTLVGNITAFIAARFNSDGSLDTTFGGSGTGYIIVPITLAGGISSLANVLDLQPDGKIVLVGTSVGTSVLDPLLTVNRFALARLNTNGTVDTTFGTNGQVVTQIETSSTANDMVIQPDGKIVAGGVATVGGLIGGTLEFALARYLTTGALDPSFSGDGIVTTPINIAAEINGLALDDCRRIVAAGISGTSLTPLVATTFTLARYQGDNTAPVANNVSAVTSTGVPVVITLSGSDADGDTLTFAIVTGPTHGTLGAITQVSPTSAQVTYTPTGSYVGPDSFTFSVTDCAGATSATPGTVSITVSSAPAARPTANPTSATVPENVPTTITLTGSDPDGLPLTFNVVTDPANGTLGTITQTSPTSADVVYAPNPNYVGPDSFTFNVTSANGTSDPAAVSINVVPSDVPAAIPQTVALNENTPVTIILVGVDPNGLPLNFTITSLPDNGTLSGFMQLTPTTAQVIYTPNNGFLGVDAFTFVVNNGTNTSAPAIVTLIVVENASPIVLGIISKYC